MAEHQAGVAPKTGPRSEPKGLSEHLSEGGLSRALREVGEPLELIREVFLSVWRRPRGLGSDIADYAVYFLRKALLPAFIVNFGYSLLAITFSSGILGFLGAANRVGEPYYIFSIRPIIPILTGVTIAGVIGTSITAEIGARKIRGELDAMRVMGQDPIRELVIPRVVSTTLMSSGICVFLLYFNLGVGAVAGSWLVDTTLGSYIDATSSNVVVPEIFTLVFKCMLIGAFIGVVSASKGLNAGAGSEGLGKAVNQAVVVCVVSVTVIHTLFDAFVQVAFPSLSVNR
jgi:phospholipid/cholesterol/gamma-HCH transport system permease protein